MFTCNTWVSPSLLYLGFKVLFVSIFISPNFTDRSHPNAKVFNTKPNALTSHKFAKMYHRVPKIMFMLSAHLPLADAVKWTLSPISVFITEGDPRIHHNCEGLLCPNILPLLLCYFHILRYNASKRGVTFGTPCVLYKFTSLKRKRVPLFNIFKLISLRGWSQKLF